LVRIWKVDLAFWLPSKASDREQSGSTPQWSVAARRATGALL